MAVASSGRTAELLRKPWKERETSPERTKIWMEPRTRSAAERKVPVVYYLSRNGHLEHPHFMEVPISSSEGLYLRDVINRLDVLRGKGMASMYSWSSKWSYKNGFVWHDLSAEDFIRPAHGHEYVLKGSEILLPASASSSPPISRDTAAEKPVQLPKSVEDDSDFPLVATRKKAPWKSFDLNEYKVYKNELTAEATVKAAADASTQTDNRRRALIRDEERAENPAVEDDNPTTELGREEISPPPSSSSPETLESLLRADGGLIPIRSDDQDRAAYPTGRMRASAVLMHLISCGSIAVKDHPDLSLVSQQYRRRLPRGASGLGAREMEGPTETPSFPAVRPDDRDYFSGSLIETKKKGDEGVAEFPGLKRSSSYNADGSSKLVLAEKEIEGVRARCIPRKPKAVARREANPLSQAPSGRNKAEM